MISQLHVGGAVVKVFGDHVESYYPDAGHASCFWPPVEDPAFREVALSAGYLDRVWPRDAAMQFGLEHELMHHFVAEYVTHLPYSRVVRRDALGRGDGQRLGWPRRGHDEEHLAGYLQHWITRGDPPEVNHASLPEVVRSEEQYRGVRAAAVLLLRYAGLRLA